MKFTNAVLSYVLWTARSSRAFGVHATTTRRSNHAIASTASTAASAALVGDNKGVCAARPYNKMLFPLTSSAASSTAAILRGGAGLCSPSFSTSSTRLQSTTADVQEKETTQQPVEIFRTDYQPLPFTVDQMEMDFDIRENKTIVKSALTWKKNPDDAVKDSKVILDGDETSVKLLSVSLNGKELTEQVGYVLKPGKMELLVDIQDGDVLETVVEIVPEENTQLSGLYKSGPMYCSQCEALGFRRITYFPDRPDNMATFTKVRLEADKEAYPVLLSNGNRIEQGDADEKGRHYSVWSDPFPKPSYLFAVVAGKLGSIQDTYTTRPSGKKVHLEIFSEPANVHKLQYAMDSLKNSMKWDEDRFDLEYDLGIYNVVATDDFNMGAMENKSLNIFNTAYVLADQETATDSDFERVEGVIGHEYFHNWTGNRVTCRDWFQLTLKEGLTVFRDQEFSGDLNSKAVNRIENVRGLRGRQFNEDAGPMSHPIRPESYVAMDNFYTATVCHV